MISDARALALCGFEGPPERSLPVSGGYGEGETPLPIPNRAVKPLSADGTWLARAWESRSPPVFFSQYPSAVGGRRGGQMALLCLPPVSDDHRSCLYAGKRKRMVA